jgi:hypothetical protein
MSPPPLPSIVRGATPALTASCQSFSAWTAPGSRRPLVTPSGSAISAPPSHMNGYQVKF